MHWNIFAKKMVAKNVKKCSFAPLKGADALFSAVFIGLVAQLDRAADFKLSLTAKN